MGCKELQIKLNFAFFVDNFLDLRSIMLVQSAYEMKFFKKFILN